MKNNLLKAILMSFFVIVCFTMSIFAKGWTTNGSDWYYYDDDGNMLTDTIKGSGNDKFYLDNNGMMVRDYLLEGYNDSIYYFDDTGKMVINTWVAVDPAQVANPMPNSPTIYLYYFGNNGKAIKASNGGTKRKSIDGKKYLFNENGQMLSGWIDTNGDRYNEYDSEDDPFEGYCYYAGDETDGVLREGWMEYLDGSVDDRYFLKQSLWFYFKPSDNKKVYCETSNDFSKRKINGKTYAFDENGVMIQGWDIDILEDYGSKKTNYYFEEKAGLDAGRMYKKEWIFAVPSKEQDLEKHDQEVEEWFYAIGGGEIVKECIRKINKDYYVFDSNGIMKKGLCIVGKNDGKFKDCIDLEKTDGKDFLMTRFYISTETYDKKTGKDVYEHFDDSTDKIYYFITDETASNYGKRKLGDVTVAFADKDYTFNSQSLGQSEGLRYTKNYYQAGVKLCAEPHIGLGLVFLGYASTSDASAISAKPVYYNSPNSYANEDPNHYIAGTTTYNKTDYIVNREGVTGAYPVYAVVDMNGNKVKKSYTHKKDKSGNYWVIGPNASFVKVFEVQVKYVRSTQKWYFRSEKSTTFKIDWIEFGIRDAYDKTCSLTRGVGDYELTLDENYCTNFRFADPKK